MLPVKHIQGKVLNNYCGVIKYLIFMSVHHQERLLASQKILQKMINNLALEYSLIIT